MKPVQEATISPAIMLTAIAFIAICSTHLTGCTEKPAAKDDRQRSATHSPTAFLLKDEELRFSIDIPEGFRESEGKPSPRTEHCYVKGAIGQEALIVISIKRLATGIIPKDQRMTKAHLPPGLNADVTTRDWRGLKIDTVVTPIEKNGVRFIVYGMQVPLSPAPILLSVGGPEEKREEVSQLADTLLASLEGETTW